MPSWQDDVRPVIPPCAVVTPRDRHFTSYTHGGAADQAGHKASLAKSDNSCRRVMTTRGRSIHLHLSIFESAPEVRVLSCAGIAARLQRSYDPVRLPSEPPPVATLRPLPSPATGLPRLPEPPFRRAVPTSPTDRASVRVDYFSARTAFPKWPEARHQHCHFRGLLRLHSRYGPPDRSAAQGDVCHEAPAQPVAQPNRSSASRSIDNSLGGIFLH